MDVEKSSPAGGLEHSPTAPILPPLERIRNCHCCGLVQQLPEMRADQRPVCRRCGTSLEHGGTQRNIWTRLLCASALLFYLPAMTLPLLRVEKLGHVHESSLLSGVAALWSQGYWLIGAVIVLFSVLLPPLKLIALWALSSRRALTRHHHRARVYHLVELLGRWGMLDVLLVAILVAMVKLGDLVTIHAGPGLLAFTTLVLLSLLASLVFNPRLMWDRTDHNP